MMEQFNHLDAKTIELAGIAASIAGGCRPCLDYHFKKAIEVGCTIEQAKEAIELGSVRCIPCQQMQPVMKSIQQKYGKQVKVVFHDVWTETGAPYAKKYGIEAIPTQVFLDETGKEFFRHTGFFPEEELIKMLNQKGVK